MDHKHSRRIQIPYFIKSISKSGFIQDRSYSNNHRISVLKIQAKSCQNEIASLLCLIDYVFCWCNCFRIHDARMCL